MISDGISTGQVRERLEHRSSFLSCALSHKHESFSSGCLHDLTMMAATTSSPKYLAERLGLNLVGFEPAET